MSNPSGCMGHIRAGSLMTLLRYHIQENGTCGQAKPIIPPVPAIVNAGAWSFYWTLLNIQKVWMELPELRILLSDYANLQLCGLEVHVQDRGKAWDRQLKRKSVKWSISKYQHQTVNTGSFKDSFYCCRPKQMWKMVTVSLLFHSGAE